MKEERWEGGVEGCCPDVVGVLDLGNVLDRDITVLSGKELQTFSLAMICVQSAHAQMNDELSLYLDVKQRLKAARTISGLLTDVAKNMTLLLNMIRRHSITYRIIFVVCMEDRTFTEWLLRRLVCLMELIFFCRACASREFEI